jgi:hypothetical protein
MKGSWIPIFQVAFGLGILIRHGSSWNMQEIFQAIDQYALAYGRLEQLQRSSQEDIPIGDQKTGAIAEFFSRIYARHRFPNAKFEFGSASEPCWDIKVLDNGRPEIKVQVKAVSAHSQTSRISPIHPGWHQLWLMRLDECFQPQTLWVFEAQNSSWSQKLLKNRTMPKIGSPRSGSAELRGGANETAQLHAALESTRLSLDP